ncbi:MAG: septum formation initiator family protein [Gammaproteobacteria bacterium]|nr:septum formation initiator family protein [Gammaproteobacteria bacterium]
MTASYRILVALLAFAAVYFQATLWVGDRGIANVFALEKEQHNFIEKNRLLKERNLALNAEVESLKSGLGAVEEMARKELGMVKDGETFFFLIDDDE